MEIKSVKFVLLFIYSQTQPNHSQFKSHILKHNECHYSMEKIRTKKAVSPSHVQHRQTKPTQAVYLFYL